MKTPLEKYSESKIMFCKSKISRHHFVVWTDVPLAVDNLFHTQMVSTCCMFPFPLAMQHTSSFAQLADQFLCVVQQNKSFKIKQQSLKRGVVLAEGSIYITV